MKIEVLLLHACETFKSIALTKEGLTPFNPNLNVSLSSDKLVIAHRYRENETFQLPATIFFTEKKDEQKGLPKSTIYGIIAGVICFLALIIAIFAIVCAKKRRSRSQGM